MDGSLRFEPEIIEEVWQAAHRDFALQMAASLPAAEASETPRVTAPLDERLVQAIWADQLLRGAELSTASGKAVQVLEPGRWNTGRGPDFLDARIVVAGEVLQGDVEIHVESADWHRHGHDRDFEYNRTVLHAVLRASDDRPYEQKQNSERLERLVLGDFLEPDLDTIRQSINPGDYPYGTPDDHGLCHQQFLRLPPAQLRDFLLAAGRSRVEAKVARFKAQRATASFLQVVYQALLVAQGYKSSKTLYFLLSKRAPIDELREQASEAHSNNRIDIYLSILLYVARLMPEQQDLIPEDPETQDFIQRLERHWRHARPYLSDRLMPPTRRWFAGIRPVSFPPRRLAAMAILCTRLLDTTDPLLARLERAISAQDWPSLNGRDLGRTWKSLAAELVVDGEASYFSTHFTIGGKKQKPQALIGEPHAMSLLFNVFLPMLILKAREEKNRPREASIWQAIHCFPALEATSVSRFMRRRLLADSHEKGLFDREIVQQSLYKVFADCCALNEKSCNDCTFLALAEKRKAKN